MELGFSLDISNSVTKKKAEGIAGIVNPRHIGKRQDGQALLSSSMLHKAGWIINDSTLLSSFLISDSLLPKSSPVHLYSDQLAILLPQLSQKYGKNKGVYLRMDNVLCKQVVVSMGRMVIHLGLLLDFIVDPDSTNYPQDSLAKCP